MLETVVLLKKKSKLQFKQFKKFFYMPYFFSGLVEVNIYYEFLLNKSTNFLKKKLKKKLYIHYRYTVHR